jgi:hypothetical protein
VTVYVRRPGDPKKWLAHITCISKQVRGGDQDRIGGAPTLPQPGLVRPDMPDSHSTRLSLSEYRPEWSTMSHVCIIS